MSEIKRRAARVWAGRALQGLPVSIALLAACGEEPTSAGLGSGGAKATTGGTSTSTTGGTPVIASGGTSSGGTGGTATSNGGSLPTAKGGTTATGGAGMSSFGGSGKGGAAAVGAGSGGASVGGVGPGSGGKASASGGAGGSGGKATGTGGTSSGKSAGCGKTSTLTFGSAPNGTGKGGSVTLGSRNFIMRLPDNYDNNKPYWLIFGFHWRGGAAADVDGGGDNRYSMAHYGLQSLSKNGAIFVAPHGLNGGWGNSGGQDMDFVDDMLETIQNNYCVDTTHIFANGFSWGGGMSYAIACERANVFRGVAIYNGAVLSGCQGGNDPIAVWQMHGLTDGTLGIGAARDMRDRFVENNGCTPQNPPEPPNPPPYLVNGGHICTDYQGCMPGKPVRWCAHQSGHGNAVVDGTGDLYNRCANPGMTCSDSCRCSWVPQDVWTWMNSL